MDVAARGRNGAQLKLLFCKSQPDVVSFSFEHLLLNVSVRVMTLVPCFVYNANNAALHSCAVVVHSVCRVFEFIRLQ